VIGLPFVRVSEAAYRDASLQVRRVALCGGSGAEFIDDAKRAGADIYLTADLKYHDFQRGGRMVLADIGHYESEQFAKDIIFRAISEKFSNFACRISETQQGIVKYI
jgi:putative NIF3 family GTP cyclohydrolase 1 type 2